MKFDFRAVAAWLGREFLDALDHWGGNTPDLQMQNILNLLEKARQGEVVCAYDLDGEPLFSGYSPDSNIVQAEIERLQNQLAALQLEKGLSLES